jgi:hypothetical protein
MASLLDDIKNERKGQVGNAEGLIIEQKLNKLFYEKPDFKEEVRMLKLQAQLKMQDRYGLHASAILVSDKDFCYREHVLSLLYKQIQGENIGINLKRIFEEGNFIGEKWQRLFIRGGLGRPEDMDISQFRADYELSFTPDAIVTINNHKYVVEVKSQNSFMFKKQAGHPKGMKQLQFYMEMTGIHRGFVLVEDKNTQEFKVLMAEYDAEDMEPYIYRLEMIQYHKKRLLKKGKMVGRICDSATCKRALKCNMKDACYDIGIGRIKLEERD